MSLRILSHLDETKLRSIDDSPYDLVTVAVERMTVTGTVVASSVWKKLRQAPDRMQWRRGSPLSTDSTPRFSWSDSESNQDSVPSHSLPPPSVSMAEISKLHLTPSAGSVSAPLPPASLPPIPPLAPTPSASPASSPLHSKSLGSIQFGPGGSGVDPRRPRLLSTGRSPSTSPTGSPRERGSPGGGRITEARSVYSRRAQTHPPPEWKSRAKAGVILFHQRENKVLLVQSEGKHWGLPKGRQEWDEPLVETALRKLFEETGVLISEAEIMSNHIPLGPPSPLPEISQQDVNSATMTEHLLSGSYSSGHVRYFVVFTDVLHEPHILNIVGNDSTGVGWIHLDCIGVLPGEPTQPLRALLQKVLGYVV